MQENICLIQNTDIIMPCEEAILAECCALNNILSSRLKEVILTVSVCVWTIVKASSRTAQFQLSNIYEHHFFAGPFY